VLERLDRVPEVGDSVEAGTHTVEVREMDGTRISTLRIIPADGARDTEET
jgi:CBS domain containing-hemolysin-like protein